MENIDLISDLKNYLIDLQYPLANTMNDIQLAEIFNRSNRCFLVSWIINRFNEACDHTIENIETTEQFLANLIHEMGICKKADSVAFMRGNLVPVESQLQIIQKLLNCLKRAYEPTPQVDILPESIENLKLLDLNFFPQYGDIKIKCNPKGNGNEHEEMRLSFAKKIEQQPKIDYEKFYQDIELWVEKTREEFPIIKAKILTIDKLKVKENETREIMHIDPNSTEGLKKCNEHLKVVNQYLIDLNSISEFNNDDMSVDNRRDNEEWRKTLLGIYEEIVEVVRYES